MKKIILSLILLLIVGSAFSQKINSDTVSQKFIVVKVKDSIVYYEGILDLKNQRTGRLGILLFMNGSGFSSSELLELFRIPGLSLGGNEDIIMWEFDADIEKNGVVVVRHKSQGIKLPSFINIYIREIKININDLK